jgi:hypothetical protein
MCLYSTDSEMWVEMYMGGSFHMVHDFVNFMLEKRASPIKVLHIARLVVITACCLQFCNITGLSEMCQNLTRPCCFHLQVRRARKFFQRGLYYIRHSKLWTRRALFCTMTNKCTFISQIITLLHVSTLLCLPQGACNQYLVRLYKYFKCSC